MSNTMPVFDVSGIKPTSKTSNKPKIWDGTKYVDASTYKKTWLTLPKADKQEVIDFAIASGKRPSEAKTLWGQLVDAASAAVAQGSQQTVWQVLATAKARIATSEPTTYTQKSKTEYTTEAVRADIDKVYMSKVGRTATDAELQSIMEGLRAQEPTTSTATYEAGGATTVTKPALTAQELAQRGIENNPLMKQEVTRMQDLEFSSWLSQAMNGGPSSSAGGLANG